MGLVACDCDPSIWEAEAEGSPQTGGQPGLYRDFKPVMAIKRNVSKQQNPKQKLVSEQICWLHKIVIKVIGIITNARHPRKRNKIHI